MVNKNNYLELDDDDDFGFTFANEDDIVTTNQEFSSLSDQVNDLKMRLQAVNKIFMPLLINLAKDPSKPMIKWPGRAEMIEKQIEKLKKLTDV